MFIPLFESRPILVVEDNREVREALILVLEDEGYPVVAANNGRDALAMMQGIAEFSLILLDMYMPTMDGRQFLAAREKMGLAPMTPVVVFSASSDVEPLRGVTEWIKKPVELTYLLDKINVYSTAGRA